VPVESLLTAGDAALAAGRWDEARASFEAVLLETETARACFGLACASWWLGDNDRSVAQCTRAYALFRQAGDAASAVRCAVWLAITYKANFANFAVANGWIGRADRLLEPLEVGPLHAWVWIARGYRMPDLERAQELTGRALTIAREATDVDLELTAMAQLGLIRVGKGELAEGFALIDEAMAAALGGERTMLDTVVYACCDMLNACELASDIERAAQWCAVADEFTETYGCPFLYAECRIYYGGVLTAKGLWADAERELDTGLRITERTCPGLHSRALTRMAALRVRQGRLEEAELLLARAGQDVEGEAEHSLWIAALLLARGDARAAVRALEQRLRHLEAHRTHLASALDLLVDAAVASGDLDAATTAADGLDALAAAAESDQLRAIASAARGRLSIARGDTAAAVEHLEAALRTWCVLKLPFEIAHARFALGRALLGGEPDVAIAHALRALQAFEGLGARTEADRVAAFLRSAGVVPRSGPRGLGVLTAREREVLRLLAAGLSNPEIAQRLHVSRKTAAHHVSNILMKLDLRNRAEAAAYAAASAVTSGQATLRT
jgi:DNA-binding NarL/FixJ family response regulator